MCPEPRARSTTPCANDKVLPRWLQEIRAKKIKLALGEAWGLAQSKMVDCPQRQHRLGRTIRIRRLPTSPSRFGAFQLPATSEWWLAEEAEAAPSMFLTSSEEMV